MKPQVVVIQMNSVPQVDENLAALRTQLQRLTLTCPTLVVVPECFACFGAGDQRLLEIAEEPGNGPIQQQLKALAKEFGVWLVAGTIPLSTRTRNKFTASCLVYNDQGQQVCEYQKIHLFDVDVADNTRSYRESRYTQAGQQVVTFDSPFGRVGVAVCFDLRFPLLFQAMGKIDLLVLPSAFTQVTGAAHWQPLLQARGIELQCYVAAANQTGVHANGRETYGHSQIVSPWGEVLCELPDQPGLALAAIDRQRIRDIRATMPLKPSPAISLNII